MDEIGINAFFCEDVRIEVGDKPMFIGVFAPTITFEDLPTKESFVFVTTMQVPANVDSFESSLQISSIAGNKSERLFEGSKFVERDPRAAGQDWLALNRFDFNDFELVDDMKIVAVATAGGVSAKRSLTVLRGSFTD